jgi:predicted AAA+ superfamily ATPase
VPSKLDQMLLRGSYPRVYAHGMEPHEWYPSYINNYIERDVRMITSVGDLSMFTRFLKLCAGRIGQLLNVSSLAIDCGISSNTARAWISVLEASYILFLLQPYHNNFSKRMIKSPKIYFYDTGIACSLLSIKTEEALATHYLRGGLFESFVIADMYKHLYNRGDRPTLYFWRDSTGHEVDCIFENDARLMPIEIKSGQTINSNFFDGLSYWYDLTKSSPEAGCLVYGGDEQHARSFGRVIGWRHADALFE